MVLVFCKRLNFGDSASESRIFALQALNHWFCRENTRDLAVFLVFWATKVWVYLRSIWRDFWNLRFFRTREISTNAVFRRALKYWDVYTKIRAEKIEKYSFFKKACKTTFSADSNICGKCLDSFCSRPSPCRFLFCLGPVCVGIFCCGLSAWTDLSV